MAKRKKPSLSKKKEILGILLITLGLLVFISLITYQPSEQPDNVTSGKTQNGLGILGVYISYYLIQFVIGYPSFIFPILIILSGWNIVRGNDFANSFQITGYLLVFAFYTSIILAIPEVISSGPSQFGYSLSGLVGGLVAEFLFDYLGITGSIVVLLALIMITVVGATNVSFANFFNSVYQGFLDVALFLQDRFKEWRGFRKIKKKRVAKPIEQEDDFEEIPSEPKAKSPVRIKPAMDTNQLRIDLEPESAPPPEAATDPEHGLKIKASSGYYQYPTLDLLAVASNTGDGLRASELTANAQTLEDRLMEFGVECSVVEINPGPVITRYDVEPAAGVKISRIAALADDLALALRAKRIRIVAPIPGKGAVGIEIPNRKPSIVFLREILNSKAFRNSESPLTIALGKTISGETFVTNLEQMPHLLIAGATGSGKSVCLNSIIASILYKSHPTKVQFVLIDPKRLELTIYNDLRHHHLTFKEDLNEEVATTPENAISVLKSMTVLMENRYEILARAGVRNIRDYNHKQKTGQLQALEHEEPFEPLSYIVLIIDELADMMLTSAKEIEEPIARLAQMARAVGIHLIVATQRPSVNVITGVIKANFPARIAFQVASKTDSRTILDLNGAEKLLGMGDMLYIPQGSPESLRIHGAYVTVDEIESIISHIRRQPRYPKQTLPMDSEESENVFKDMEANGARDALFDKALKLVVLHQQGSISLLQRRLKVGYARAARLVDELEAAGIVGPYDGSKARQVLVDEEELEEMGLGLS